MSECDIDEFVAESQAAFTNFKQVWEEKAKTDPENFPDKMSMNHWLQEFNMYRSPEWLNEKPPRFSELLDLSILAEIVENDELMGDDRKAKAIKLVEEQIYLHRKVAILLEAKLYKMKGKKNEKE
jgi:hypothetical protein